MFYFKRVHSYRTTHFSDIFFYSERYRYYFDVLPTVCRQLGTVWSAVPRRRRRTGPEATNHNGRGPPSRPNCHYLWSCGGQSKPSAHGSEEQTTAEWANRSAITPHRRGQTSTARTASCVTKTRSDNLFGHIFGPFRLHSYTIFFFLIKYILINRPSYAGAL